MKSNLTYAIHNDELVHISQVVSGVACNCICPNQACAGKLIARKGKKKAHHFAHYNLEDCGGSVESALHLLAKEIISKAKTFKLPALYGRDSKTKREAKVSNKLIVDIEKVELEVNYGDFQPDIVLIINGRRLFIEIAVTHFVDDLKLKKIKNTGVSTIEIDLSHLKNGFIKEELEKILIHKASYKYWIYNNKIEAITKKHFDKIDKALRAEDNFYNYLNELKQYKIDLAKYNGHSVIEFSEYGKICCLKLLSEQLKSVNVKHKIFDKLRKREIWDGDMNTTNGGADYILLNNERDYFRPGYRKQELSSKKELFEYKRMWAILNKLSKQSFVEESQCRNCKFFVDIFDNDTKIVCKYYKS